MQCGLDRACRCSLLRPGGSAHRPTPCSSPRLSHPAKNCISVMAFVGDCSRPRRGKRPWPHLKSRAPGCRECRVRHPPKARARPRTARRFSRPLTRSPAGSPALMDLAACRYWPIASAARSAVGAEASGMEARRGETRAARLDAQHDSPTPPRGGGRSGITTGQAREGALAHRPAATWASVCVIGRRRLDRCHDVEHAKPQMT